MLSRDEDWKTIVELNTMFMDKVVNSKESFNSVTLNDEEKILSIIGMSREEYLGKVAKAKSAAERILTKYNISKNLNASCASCNLQKNEKDFADFKQSINFFKSNRSTYEQQRQNIITTSLVAASRGWWETLYVVVQTFIFAQPSVLPQLKRFQFILLVVTFVIDHIVVKVNMEAIFTVTFAILFYIFFSFIKMKYLEKFLWKNVVHYIFCIFLFAILFWNLLKFKSEYLDFQNVAFAIIIVFFIYKIYKEIDRVKREKNN